MTSAIHQLQAFPACGGDVGLVVGAHPSGPAVTDRSVELELATLLGEREAGGARVPVVVLHQAGRGDTKWVVAASRWLAAHGRRPLIRTATTLSMEQVHAAATTGATVVLELAHRRLELQRALLGADVDDASALLLHAQHLVARAVPVAAHIGPLLPTIHDVGTGTLTLLQHVAAAGVRSAHLSVGQLGPGRIRALAAVLDRAELLELMRAFGADPAVLDGDPTNNPGVWRLAHAVHFGLYHDVELMAEDAGLHVDACGCAAQCQLDRPAREYLPLLGPDLFERTAG